MVVSIFAWVNGNPLILIHPTDTQGRICGLQYKDMNLTAKIHFFTLMLQNVQVLKLSSTFNVQQLKS